MSLRGSPHHPFVVASGPEVRVCDTERGIGYAFRQERDPVLIARDVDQPAFKDSIWWTCEYPVVVSPDGKALITAEPWADGLSTWDLQPLLEHRGSKDPVSLADAVGSMALTVTLLKGPQVMSSFFLSP